MDFRYARPPPPPPSSDPHQPPPRQQPVPPPPGTWYPGQFQYHSPSPPPPHWAPQPQHSDHHIPPPHLSYATPPPPPPPPYGSNPYSLPPRPHVPPPPPPPPNLHYAPVNQEWSNTSWGQVWDYSVHNKNEDDWAARAKEWAASKAVTDDQHQQSQLGHAVRPEEINYQDQYSQNPSYTEFQQHSHPPSSYQQYPSFPPPPRMTVNHVQDSSPFNSGYTFPYTARDENSRGDSTASYSHQETAPTNLPVHQQEVPSSYSSVAGKEEGGVINGKFYQPSHLPYASAPQHQVQPLMPPNERSFSTGQPHYSLSNPSSNPTTDLSNQPLDFGPRFNHDHDPFGHSKYANASGVQVGAVSTATDMPSIHSWSSSAPPGMLYPSIPSVHHTEQQIDPSVSVPTSISAHSAPLFGRPSFQPTMPSVSPPFPVGTSNAFLATNAFPGDIYGTPGFPERPKKASVPNWLREEIIKKKAVIGSSGPELSKQETESNEDDSIERSVGIGDQADDKNMDASRSTEEEDDDEDYVEAARTAAINQEIKRILTEVLLKVTDELFDDIATKVLNEDNFDVEVEHNTVGSSEMTAPSTPVISYPKPSTKVLVPAKTKETDLDDVTGKYTSSSPGDVLGLGNYASDDDEDEEVQNSSIPSSKSSKPSVHLSNNGSSQVDGGVSSVKNPEEVINPQGVTPNGATDIDPTELTHNTIDVEPNIDHVTEELHNDVSDGEKASVLSDVLKSKENVGDKGVGNIELPIESLTAKNSFPDDAHGRTGKNGPDKSDVKDRTQRKVDENIRVEDERHMKRAKKDDQNGSRDKVKERDSGKKVSKADAKDDRKGSERDRRSHAKEDDRKRDRAKDERRRPVGDSSKHKRHRSSSPESRGRSSKDKSVNHAHASSDGSSDDSRRRVHSKRRGTSPSNVRSRRQVSRSPPSKRSQRRHSPYSFLETKRERRRSRSRTRKG